MNFAFSCVCSLLLAQSPPPANPPPAPPRPLTLEEFAATFKPEAGSFEVLFLHPATKQPVRVTFTLPTGTPKVRVDKRDVIFDYGSSQVRLRFRVLGKVAVITN